MIRYVLQITLRSPLASGGGEGRVGLVDRDAVFDDLGLPVLPGRRLKGLWREAYRDVAEAWALCGQPAMSVEWIFGAAGQLPGNGDACLHVANAELHDASSWKPWLTYLQHHRAGTPRLHADDVIQHFAAVRAQTAIDRRTGAAREDTLRLTRTLLPGLTFWAPVHFVDPPDAELRNALALAAAALQRMGTARTRGLGQVCCRLFVLDTNGQTHDLLEQICLSDNTLPAIAAANPAPAAGSREKQRLATPPRSHHATLTHILRYRLCLTAPAVIPTIDGDPNTVTTRQHVPGSHLWGSAAWHYLRHSGHTPQDRAFRYAFLDGGLRFLAAYPEIHEPFDGTWERLIPVPHSIRKHKHTDQLVDLALEKVTEPAQRLNSRYAKIGHGQLESQRIKTAFHYHHARARDRRKGRALGAESNDGGAFFVYEAIQANQTFQGAILGTESDLQALQYWLREVTSITIGRSRSAQYGAAKFEWMDEMPQTWQTIASEWDGFVNQASAPTMPPLLGERLIITTLSPLLTRNDHGHPEACFPQYELARAVGLDPAVKKPTLTCSYTRTELIGGYHAHLRLPRQQWPTIAAGSVFVFDIESVQSDLTQERLWQLEQAGLGLRKGEGYGRIAVNRQDNRNLTGTKEKPIEDQHANPTVPATDMPSSIQKLLCDLVRMRCLKGMQRDAANVAQAISSGKVPSRTLIGRLRLLLQQDVLLESLDELRPPAKEQLMNCRIDTSRLDILWLQNQSTLHDLFKKALSRPEALTQKLIAQYVGEFFADYSEMTSTLVDVLDHDDHAAMCREFLLHLLTALHRQVRT